MIIKIKGEHNFFLFQDIVYYFGLTLKFKWRYPIKNKYTSKSCPCESASKFIYDSWYEIFIEKLEKCGRTNYYKKLVNKLNDWIVTTNIAILTAQEGRGSRELSSRELESIKEHSPSFLIEHSDDFETYIVHLNDEIAVLFNEAILFYQTIEHHFNTESFISLLRRYFIFDDDYLTEEIPVIIDNFIGEKEYFMAEDVYTKEGDEK